MMSSLTKKSSRSGYTLSELSFVLLIIGLTFTTIWSVAGSVSTDSKISKITQQTMMIVKNVRNAYGLTGKTPAAADFTSEAASLGIFPSEMGTTSIVHALGGNVVLYAVNANVFSLRLGGIQYADCVKIITKFPTTTPELRIRGIGTSTGGVGTVAAAAPIYPDVNPTAVPAINAVNYCSAATNEVRIDFSFR